MLANGQWNHSKLVLLLCTEMTETDFGEHLFDMAFEFYVWLMSHLLTLRGWV